MARRSRLAALRVFRAVGDRRLRGIRHRCENENEAQRFWIFEGSVLVTGLFSSLSVVFRRKHLDRKMMERIQQQVAAGV